jgi:hypothetical protein
MLLRSTDEMAAQFVERVQARIGEPIPEADILAVMKKIPAKSLTMQKVVTKAQQRRRSPSRQTSRKRTVRTTGPNKTAAGVVNSTATVSAPTNSRAKPKTVLEQLNSVLDGNWERAEAEGLSPKRMSAAAFVNAIHQYTDRREGTRQRILKAARQLDGDDVILTPALVADTVHELFES